MSFEEIAKSWGKLTSWQQMKIAFQVVRAWVSNWVRGV